MILVVEDDYDISELICHHLNKEGFETLAVYDGQQAVEKVRSEQIEIVLLDLNLPKMGGLEVLKDYPVFVSDGHADHHRLGENRGE